MSVGYASMVPNRHTSPTDLIKAADARGQDVARVHSGDPSLYGAIGEQIRCLRELGIAFEIIPGVTATAACAAILGAELTLPDISQTVILTRYAEKTVMPAGEGYTVLTDYCKGCGVCVEECPTGSMIMLEELR